MLSGAEGWTRVPGDKRKGKKRKEIEGQRCPERSGAEKGFEWMMKDDDDDGIIDKYINQEFLEMGVNKWRVFEKLSF